MSTSSLKILMLADAESFHTERFKQAVLDQGYDIKLASLETGPLVDYPLQKVGFFAKLYYILSVKQISEILHEFNPDIISAHYASGYGFVASLLPGNTPVALSLWGSDIFIVPHKSILHHRKTVKALEGASLIFADSTFLLSSAKELKPDIKGEVIPWGIEKKYIPLCRQDYHLPEKPRVIVPRMHKPVYNNLFIVEALADLITSDKIDITFPNFGPDTQQFKRASSKLVGDRIHYYDKLPRNKLMPFLSEHDIYLSASKSDSSPVSLIEAMGLGLIPVVADIPGVREWLSASNSLLFSLDSKDSLEIAVETILSGKVEIKRIRDENHQRILSEAIFEDNISRHLELMQTLVHESYEKS